MTASLTLQITKNIEEWVKNLCSDSTLPRGNKNIFNENTTKYREMKLKWALAHQSLDFLDVLFDLEWIRLW